MRTWGAAPAAASGTFMRLGARIAELAGRKGDDGKNPVSSSQVLRDLGVMVAPGHSTVIELIRIVTDGVRARPGYSHEKLAKAWDDCVRFDAIALRLEA